MPTSERSAMHGSVKSSGFWVGLFYRDANTAMYAVERIEPYRTLLEPLWDAAQQQQIS